MDRIQIQGGLPLHGTIEISGAKNAALPLMAASLLTPETLILTNVPDLADITTLAQLLRELGVTADAGPGNLPMFDAKTPAKKGCFVLRAAELTNTFAPYDLVRKMRASVLVLGPLLARTGEARVSLPGGCAIGPRPVDLHLKGLQALGADITLHDGYIDARAPHGLRGTTVRLPSLSVGATENLLMAATLASGETIIENAAREPEIGDLARCLSAMGADISGIGSERLVIRGVPALGSAAHEVLPDRIETGTYVIAAGITGGELDLHGTRLGLIGSATSALEEAGMEISETNQGIRVRPFNGRLVSTDVSTQPFPGFPTDLQAQFMALMASAEGTSTITENIFENRYMHVPELQRMGADISVHGATASVHGVERLTGAPVMATDLRASVSLVLAGLAAEGETTISRVYHLDRGYEDLVGKLTDCGARIERLSD